MTALPDHTRVPGEALALIDRLVHDLAAVVRWSAMSEQHWTSRFTQ